MALSTRSGSRWVCHGLGCRSMHHVHGPLRSLVVLMPVQIPGIYKIRHIGQTTITTGAVRHLVSASIHTQQRARCGCCNESARWYRLGQAEHHMSDMATLLHAQNQFAHVHADLWDIPSSRCSAALRAMM